MYGEGEVEGLRSVERERVHTHSQKEDGEGKKVWKISNKQMRNRYLRGPVHHCKPNMP